jgi:quercetin dioxygenase-like cupin family protein
MSTFGELASLGATEPHPGVRLRLLSSSDCNVREYTFSPSSTFPLHRHPEEQITLVLEGSVEMSVGGAVSHLPAGAWAIVESNVEHGVSAGPDGARLLAVVRRNGAVPGDH